jgi:hypothetical protein
VPTAHPPTRHCPDIGPLLNASPTFEAGRRKNSILLRRRGFECGSHQAFSQHHIILFDPLSFLFAWLQLVRCGDTRAIAINLEA